MQRRDDRLLGVRLGGHRAVRRPAADHDLRLQHLARGPDRADQLGDVGRRVRRHPGRGVKVQIGVPTYGYDWPSATIGCPVDNLPVRRSHTATAAAALAVSLGRTTTWNATYAERTFTYAKTYTGALGDRRGRPRARSPARSGTTSATRSSCARTWSAPTTSAGSRCGPSAARTSGSGRCCAATRRPSPRT